MGWVSLTPTTHSPPPRTARPQSHGDRGLPRVSPYLCWEREEPLPSIPTGRRQRSSRAAGPPYGSAPSRCAPRALRADAAVPPPGLRLSPQTHHTTPGPTATPGGCCRVTPVPPPRPALTALGVKPPGWHAGGHHWPGVGGQGDGQMDGAGQRHLRPVAGEEVDAESSHRRQLQPGGIGCGDKAHGVTSQARGGCPPGSPHSVPPYRRRPARSRGRRGRRGPRRGRWRQSGRRRAGCTWSCGASGLPAAGTAPTAAPGRLWRGQKAGGWWQHPKVRAVPPVPGWPSPSLTWGAQQDLDQVLVEDEGGGTLGQQVEADGGVDCKGGGDGREPKNSPHPPPGHPSWGSGAGEEGEGGADGGGGGHRRGGGQGGDRAARGGMVVGAGMGTGSGQGGGTPCMPPSLHRARAWCTPTPPCTAP